MEYRPKQHRDTSGICDECRMRLIPKRRHQRFHDERLNGIPWTPHKSEQVVGHVGDLRVVHVNYRQPKYIRKRAWKVGSYANKDTRYDFGVYDPYWPDNEALIGIMNGRAVGMLVTQTMLDVWQLTWDQYDNETEVMKIAEASGRRGCGFLWVLKRYRGKDLARIMADIAVARSDFPKEEFPWLYPFSDLGEGFIRHYCPQQFAAGMV